MTYENKTGLPSVTRILSPWVDTRWFLHEHSERGKSVHHHLAAYLFFQYVPKIKKEWRGYVESGMRWIDKHVTSTAAVETRFVDPDFGYSGKPDFFGKASIFQPKEYGIIDWKTGGHHRTHPLQIAAYSALARKKYPELEIKAGAAVYLNETGEIAKHQIYIDQTLDFNIFLSALNCWKFF